VQVIDGPLDRIDSSCHHPSVLGTIRVRGHVCQVSNRSSSSHGPGITVMWFM
jgi:hypothetical protein